MVPVVEWVLGVAVAGVVVGLAPVVALIEMVVAVVARVKGGNGTSKGGVGRFLAEGMSIDSSGFRLFYRLALMASWGSAAGSWMFWVMYLKLEGGLFCPEGVVNAFVLWLLYPLGVDLFFWGFRSVTGIDRTEVSQVSPVLVPVVAVGLPGGVVHETPPWWDGQQLYGAPAMLMRQGWDWEYRNETELDIQDR